MDHALSSIFFAPLSLEFFGAGGKGKKSTLEKSDFLTADRVSDSDIEAAYEVYKAAALEQEFKGSLEKHFSDRFASERQAIC